MADPHHATKVRADSVIFKSIMRRGACELIRLGRIDCPINGELIASAKRELMRRGVEHASCGVHWGYLLGIEREITQAAFISAWQLCDELDMRIASVIGGCEQVSFRFSFCKVYSGPVLKEDEGVHYEGLHIDTHPGLDDTTDLLRVLINVDEQDRRFRFVDATRGELARLGLYNDRANFRADHVADFLPVREVCIPRRDESSVAFLVFWASVVPHVGVAEAPGYFLYSYEALAPSPGLSE
jgi:hypothetical protein